MRLPRTETALLAETESTPATGVGRGISEEETLAAVASISNPSMPTEAEFLNTDVDMEESPESFEPLSHQTPHLPEIPEKKPPMVTDRTPKKKRGKPSGKGRKHSPINFPYVSINRDVYYTFTVPTG